MTDQKYFNSMKFSDLEFLCPNYCKKKKKKKEGGLEPRGHDQLKQH